jgi:nucleotide-binding universal stress UspA family protein
MSGWSRVVVGVDGSAESDKALRWAYDEARAHGADLVVVAARPAPVPPASPPPYGGFPWSAGGAPATDLESLVTAAVKSALGEDAEDVRIEVRQGAPAPVLLAAAKGADLLVVGSRGAGAFTGMLLGSVSLHAATHAPCAVTVVR